MTKTMTALSAKFLNNLKNERPQHKLQILFCSMPESNGCKNWTVSISISDKDFLSFENIVIYRGEYFDQARYYGDLMKYILGIGNQKTKPKSWEYDGKIEDAPEDFDFVAYSNELAENQEYLELNLYCTPESNGKTNWRVTIGSKKIGDDEHFNFYLTEKYNQAHFTYDEILYCIGQKENEPEIDEYN